VKANVDRKNQTIEAGETSGYFGPLLSKARGSRCCGLHWRFVRSLADRLEDERKNHRVLWSEFYGGDRKNSLSGQEGIVAGC